MWTCTYCGKRNYEAYGFQHCAFCNAPYKKIKSKEPEPKQSIDWGEVLLGTTYIIMAIVMAIACIYGARMSILRGAEDKEATMQCKAQGHIEAIRKGDYHLCVDYVNGKEQFYRIDKEGSID